jgi:uncharacterized protein
MPIILGNIPQALEGGEVLPTVRRIARPLMGAIRGNIVSVTVLISLAPHRAQAAAGGLPMLAAFLLLSAPRFTLSNAWARPAGFGVLQGRRVTREQPVRGSQGNAVRSALHRPRSY